MAQRHSKISLKPGKPWEALKITPPNAAGIDRGSVSRYVAVPADRDDELVREFASFPEDLGTLGLHSKPTWLFRQVRFAAHDLAIPRLRAPFSLAASDIWTGIKWLPWREMHAA
ncbi:hypothetical protein ACJU26_01205 [Acidithiobacillus sp. M4-SHS-6]|uniref:hypothetical protein n=1 Tax=Acidithiobacillus sp. M4-SHS-6 TaxID=3383024 RepID=UPI0039BE5E51